MTKKKTTPRSKKKNTLSHPEDIYKSNRHNNVMDDELRVNALKRGIAGITSIIDGILSMWKGKEKPSHVGMEIQTLSSRRHGYQEELNKYEPSSTEEK